jgi:hypothetical protein
MSQDNSRKADTLREASGSPTFSCRPTVVQKCLEVLSQCDLHVRLCLFEGDSLNSDGRVFAAAIPAVVAEPKLAFDAKARLYSKRNSVTFHLGLPANPMVR